VVDVFVEGKLAIKNESQVSPRILGSYYWSSKQRKIERGRVEDTLRSAKMENFSFGVFNGETKTI